MDFQTLLSEYTKFCKCPGMKAYAWKRVLELSEILPEWKELPDLVTEAVRNDPKAVNPTTNRARTE